MTKYLFAPSISCIFEHSKTWILRHCSALIGKPASPAEFTAPDFYLSFFSTLLPLLLAHFLFQVLKPLFESIVAFHLCQTKMEQRKCTRVRIFSRREKCYRLYKAIFIVYTYTQYIYKKERSSWRCILWIFSYFGIIMKENFVQRKFPLLKRI